MVDFFQNIFGAVISAMASVIIAVGLVSVPQAPEQPLQVKQLKEEVVIERVEPKEIKQDAEKQNGKAQNQKTKERNGRIESLKKEIEKIVSQIRKIGISTPIMQSVAGETEVERLERQRNLYANAVEADKKRREEESKKQHEEIEKELQLALKGGQESVSKQEQPRLILFQDNLGNAYTEERDFTRIAGEPFNHGFGASYTPLCLQMPSTEDCQPMIVKWVNDRSIEIGKNLNIALSGFDANNDSIFYFVSYGSRKDFSFGNMRILQLWSANNSFNIPITEQLYNETLFDNLAWSSTFFEAETRKYYEKNVKLSNAGELNIHLCLNDKPQKMESPYGEQFPDGCVLFKYFILKPEYSALETTTTE